MTTEHEDKLVERISRRCVAIQLEALEFKDGFRDHLYLACTAHQELGELLFELMGTGPKKKNKKESGRVVIEQYRTQRHDGIRRYGISIRHSGKTKRNKTKC